MANFTLARRDSYLEYLHAGVKQDTQHYVLLPFTCIHFSQTIYSSKMKRKCPEARRGILLASHTGNPFISIHMLPVTSLLISQTGSVLSQLGSKSENTVRFETFHRWWPRTGNLPAKARLSIYLETHVLQILILSQGCHKRKCKFQLLSQLHRNKLCERCFLCRSLEICKSCFKCPGLISCEPQGSNSTQKGLHPPLPVETQLGQITNCHKQLYKSPQKPRPCGGPVSAGEQKCSWTGSKSKFTGVLQPAIFGTQTQQPVETCLGSEHLEHLPKHRVIQNGDTRDNKNLPTGRGLGHLHRFQGRILPYTNSQSVQEVHAFSYPGPILPVQGPNLWSVHSTHGVHSGGQRDQTDGLTEGYKAISLIHQFLDDWLVRTTSHQTCLQHTPTLVAFCRELGWLVNKEKSELDPKQVFNFVGYQCDLREDKVKPTPVLADLNRQDIVKFCPVRCTRSGSSCPT